MDRILYTWQTLVPPNRRQLLLDLSIPFWTYLVIHAGFALYNSKSPKPLSSPRKLVQSSTHSDEAPYPPDALPGARDVDSPYGSVRVYEWGPASGRKVLFVHGISTPCIAFASLAQQLVDCGCRVMLFDLFGRGYSDTPDPRTYRQDSSLWTAQILTVLASSELNWTGSGERFTLVGYSLGGGIGANFTSYFPHLVESLVLIAPAGLLRHSRIATSSKLLYSGLLPATLVEYVVRRRLRGNTPYTPPSKRKPKTISDAAEAEIPADTGHPALAPNSPAPIFPDRPAVSIADAVAWQVDTHPGFLPAFISSIRHAPVSDEHERWSLIGQRCAARRAGAEDVPGLDENKVLVLPGAQDTVVPADDIEEDATAALGRENVKVVRLQGGHDLPVVNARGCCEAIVAFWGESAV